VKLPLPLFWHTKVCAGTRHGESAIVITTANTLITANQNCGICPLILTSEIQNLLFLSQVIIGQTPNKNNFLVCILSYGNNDIIILISDHTQGFRKVV
jgi:hypothetical protein